VSTDVQKLLDAFDALAEADKQQSRDEILRRLTNMDAGDLSENTLLEAADALFLALDAEEARHAAR
jgi:hypothetical protein